MGYRQPDKTEEVFNAQFGNSTNYLIAKKLEFGKDCKYDIREYYTNKEGIISPGTKGIRISSELLLDLMVELYNSLDRSEQIDFQDSVGIGDYCESESDDDLEEEADSEETE